MASTYLTKTLGTPTNNKKFTFSCWVKKNSIASTMDIFHAGAAGSDEAIMCRFESDGYITIKHDVGSTQEMLKQTAAKYRDPNAWYHIVTVFDTDNSTAEDRQKIYVNGERITEWLSGSDDNFSQGDDILANKAVSHTIGKRNFDNNHYLDGVLSHVHFCDGQAYQATDFGQIDATTGEWSIKTSPSVSYGNNGFFILKDGNSVTDQSGNSNNWTVAGGTLTKTEDCPSNIFATLNPLLKPVSSMTYGNANTTITTSGSQWEGSVTTIAPTSGKWYWEAKYNTGSGIKLDIARETADLRNMSTANQSYLAYHGDGYGYQLNNSGTDYYCANNSCTTWNSSVNGNSTKIYMVAVDLDNGKMWIGANGTWANKTGTANPVTGDDPLHEFSAKLNGEPWLFSMSVEGGSGSHNANFGNGYFGTTAVSSAGTNASNLGIFEYDVPTGYTALCTKGLNE